MICAIRHDPSRPLRVNYHIHLDSQLRALQHSSLVPAPPFLPRAPAIRLSSCAYTPANWDTYQNARRPNRMQGGSTEATDGSIRGETTRFTNSSTHLVSRTRHTALAEVCALEGLKVVHTMVTLRSGSAQRGLGNEDTSPSNHALSKPSEMTARSSCK